MPKGWKHAHTNKSLLDDYSGGGGSGGVTDHGELTGLSDDDHSQYHNDTRGDARYLYRENSGSFTPDGDYEPATKKYVDDNISIFDPKPYLCTDDTGNQSIASEITLNLQNEKITDDNYSLSSSEITITAAGTYFCSYGIVYDITNTSGGTRGRVIAWVESDDGGSYTTISGSHAGVYHREAAGGSGLSHGFIFKHNNGNKKIKLQTQRDTGSTNIDTVGGKVSLSLWKMK